MRETAREMIPMKTRLTLTWLFLLTFISIPAFATLLICDDPSGWNRIRFEIPADSKSPVKTEFLTLSSDRKTYVAKDHTTCESKDELIKRGVADKIRASCWVIYGPDGGPC